MNDALSGLAIEVIWFDRDMMEIRLKVSNGKFAGQATFYAPLDALGAFAKHIESFPSSTSDAREYEFGGASVPGYGGANIRLYCKDANGNLIAQVSVYRAPISPTEVTESATVQINTVPAAIDAFVEELRQMRVQIGNTAVLRHAT